MSQLHKKKRGHEESDEFIWDTQDEPIDPDDEREEFGVVNPEQKPLRNIESRERKVKIIANWNFKGGVGKTTSSFGLAYAFREKMKCKVMMVDADPQKNLTQLISRYYQNRFSENPVELARIEAALDEESCGFYRAMNRVMTTNKVEAAKLIEVDIESSPDLDAEWDADFKGQLSKDLYLLPGAFATSLLERELYSGYEYNTGTADAPRVGGYPAVFWNLIRRTAAALNIEYVIVDLSPAFSILNANIIFSSDVFVIPCAPERFSIEALKSIPQILNRGKYFNIHVQWMQNFRSTVADANKYELFIDASYLKFPQHAVQFAGVMITRFPYGAIEKQNVPNRTKYVFKPSSQRVSDFIREINLQSVILAQKLPARLTHVVHSLNWVSNHQLELGRFPEFHQLGLIAQNCSIPCGYMSNRLMLRYNVSKKSHQKCRYHHRESLEMIVRTLCDNFLIGVEQVSINP
eukprot:gene29178-35214_t